MTTLILVLFLGLILAPATVNSNSSKKNKIVISELADVKDWKKLIKSKTNVLICYGNGKNSFTNSDILSSLKEVAELVRGIGTIAVADCAGEGKKLCKKVKASPAVGQYVIKHYHNGDFNKDYDRANKVSSFVNFMKDPTGDLPWDEDETAQDIVHFPDLPSLLKLVKKEGSSGKGILVMFYAPWCGFCKRMKPDYASAAKELLKDDAIIAAIDVNKPENGAARQKYNITGFPTLLFFRNGQMRQHYEGENNKDSIVSFMRNPDAPPMEKPKEEEWSDEPSEVVHLTVDSFDTVLKANPSVLVMFYAPWCGHCKRMKPEYVAAAEKLKINKVAGVLAAVDATKEPSLAKRFDVQGYPTVKYFKDGELSFDANVRDEASIVKFMESPKEPPPPPPPEKHWSEEESAVVHLDESNFKLILRKKKHALVMFYAPWCGHCKAAKPEFTAAAEEMKDDPKIMYAAVDCTQHQSVCNPYDVKGFPTFKIFHYFNKEDVRSYDGGRTKTAFIEEFNPSAAAPDNWEDFPGHDSVVKLTDQNLEHFVSSNDQVLLMFYAPWCHHCKTAKPEFARAAHVLETESPKAKMAAIDCIQYPQVYHKHEISGYPTIKYFRKGKFIGEYEKQRRAMDFVQFMLRDPQQRDEL